MRPLFICSFFVCLGFLSQTLLLAQESKVIEIRKAGGATQNEEKFPGANILFKSSEDRVHLFHEGALIVSDRAYFYAKENFFKAEGTVVFTQGDSLRMTCNHIEYDGITKRAVAEGSVFLKRPDMSLKTETLYLDRIKNEAFYNTQGVIVDSASTLSSNRGTYFMNEKKYRFVSNVKIENPKYTVTSNRLDYYTALDQAYLYGPTQIVGEDYEILCEEGFYDTKRQLGNFEKNATIFYDEKVIKGDSLYFEEGRSYAAATKNISILDSLNNSLILGHYGEIFKARDSAIITRNALAINIVEKDSLFIHADTLLATGPPEKRVIRGYFDVRIFKEDVQGRSDSLEMDQSIGLIKLLRKPLTRREKRIFNQKDVNFRNPALWFGGSQMTGDTIHLISNMKTKKLDSLKIRGNVFIVEKDSLSDEGFNQIKGGLLDGAFKEGKLDNIKVVKNTEVIYYIYDDKTLDLVGVDKTTCSALQMQFENGGINQITFLVSPEGNVFPEEELPENERKFNGFIWREVQRPKGSQDLFSKEDALNDPPNLRNTPKQKAAVTKD